MYARIVFSSRPTVETKYPRAKKMLPYKIPLPLTIYPRQVYGALPLDVPNHLRNAYFGGIAINMCTWSLIKCPSSIRLSFCPASFLNTSPRCDSQLRVKRLATTFRDPYHVILALPIRRLNLSYSSVV